MSDLASLAFAIALLVTITVLCLLCFTWVSPYLSAFSWPEAFNGFYPVSLPLL